MSDLIHEGPKDPNKPPVPGEEKPTTERERMKKVYTYVAILTAERLTGSAHCRT